MSLSPWLRKSLVLIAVVLSALPTSAAQAESGTGHIAAVATGPGAVSFVLSDTASAIPMDPGSVVVSAAGRSLAATAKSVGAVGQRPGSGLRVVYVVLDTSGSMAGEVIAAARRAAAQYARALPTDVRLGLIAFSSRPRLLVRATADRGSFDHGLAQVRTGGGTALYDAVQRAADLLRALPSRTQSRILVLSDGDDTASKSTQAGAFESLHRGGIAADVVAFRGPSNQRLLERMASGTHGVMLGAASAEKLAAAFATAARVFQNQLKISAQVPQALAGRTETITVRVQRGGGGAPVTASRAVTFAAAAAPESISAPLSGHPMVRASSHGLWVVVMIAFLACLAVALAAIFGPVIGAEKVRSSLRLAQVSRYRVVGAAGASARLSPAGWAAPSPAATSAIGVQALRAADRVLRSRGIRSSVASELDAAGLRIRPEEWAIVYGMIVLGSAVVVELFVHSVLGLPLGALLGVGGVRVFLRWRRARRENAFVDQLPDTLQLIAGSLRAGFSLQQALSTVVHEGTEPTASEFARALTEARLGTALEDALDGAATRMRCQDLAWVVMAVRISREVGGNLAEVVGTTVVTMRHRAELRGTVRSLSAEGRISAKILLGMPFVLALAVSFLRPGYLAPLFSTVAGLLIVVPAAVMLVVGAFWINRMIKIEV